jgi:hypothetical protein
MEMIRNKTSPGLMRRFWETWKRAAKKIGDIQARLLLTFFYFIVLAPFALALRRWSDPLAIKDGAAKGWRARGTDDGSPREQAARQF